ncbi:AAA family ATPase [Thalassotalea castellviae]|uniref:AAA family ATPase n=1 Tax=Thalassotalea castellviae TaxID=3075612 RepID=A0ABU3A0L7_9GAMM|nr:AAA family ATPase [Thalassotalea sp. W431]MDT0602668.1 AAA family ATPase [Thalassotalea sp. W431]
MMEVTGKSHTTKATKRNFRQMSFELIFSDNDKPTSTRKKLSSTEISTQNEQSMLNSNREAGKLIHPENKSCNISKSNRKLLLDKIRKFISYGHEGYEHSTSWLVQRILPAQSIGFLIGDSQSFKSFISVAVAACIATGRNFGDLKVPKQKLVFLIAAEGGGSIPKRIKAESEKYGEVGEQLIVIQRPINLKLADEAQMLSALISEEEDRQGLKAGLVILDTYSQCVAGMDENSAADVAVYLNACTDFSTKHNVTILNVHHNNRGGSYRGSGALFANSDFILIAKRNEKLQLKTTISIDKHKDASTEYFFEMSLEKHDLGLFDEFGEKIDTLSISRPSVSEGKKPTPPKKLSKGQQNADWLLAQLSSAQTKNMPQTDLIEMFMKTFNQDKDASKQAIYRAVKVLSEKNLVATKVNGKSKQVFLVT